MQGILLIRDLIDLILLLLDRLFKLFDFLAQVVFLGLQIYQEDRLLHRRLVLLKQSGYVRAQVGLVHSKEFSEVLTSVAQAISALIILRYILVALILGFVE